MVFMNSKQLFQHLYHGNLTRKLQRTTSGRWPK